MRTQLYDAVNNPKKNSSEFLKELAFYFQIRPWTIHQYYIGGSYAKGTTVGGHSDVDVVLALNGIGSHDPNWMTRVLTVLSDSAQKFTGAYRLVAVTPCVFNNRIFAS